MTLTLERRVDTLLREIDAGRRPASHEVSAVCAEIAAIPRGTTTMPVWKWRELDEARRELQRTRAERAMPPITSALPPNPLELEADQMRRRSGRYAAGVARGLPAPQRAIHDLLAGFRTRRSALDAGQRLLNDAAVRELTQALINRGYAAPE
ncbi:hypothetical protein [Actinomycetospora sp. NBRC 106378]|uniref:hypothetical protein n=1 Tax=Actinomycetospora sp. NBRC 106378 TaxID=3032208 RepID=UPI0024A53AB4|nr:hypothetical protein [Actinomycetospora sp. NBRC 106378]GLZ51351.1 hypothetical protein Acsp07_09680 [Actinomycetospora sp. NBRC 106378]